MPPSRGLWPAGHFISRISRPPIALRTNVRQLSSASLVRNGTRLHVRVAAGAVPAATGYVLVSGKANLSLWPFSSAGGKSSTPPPEALPVPSSSATAPLPSSTPTSSDTSASAASISNNGASTAASTASAQSQATPASLPDTPSLVSPTESSQPTFSALQGAAEATTTNPVLPENITYIGQMKELGLDFGWGPTATVEWVVEHIHVYAGTPWWGTIVAASIITRILMIYPFYRMSNMQARIAKIHPEMQKYMVDYKQAQEEGDKMAAQIASKQIGALRKRNKVSMSWMIVPIVVQGIFGFGAFKLTRAMAALPVPGFEAGGFGWMKNLTVVDPTYITPVLLCASMHFMARWNTTDVSASADPSMSKMAKPLTLYILPTMMFVIAAFQPAALQLTFLVATIFGTVQNLVFKSTWFRSAFGMEAMPHSGVMRPRLNLNTTGANGRLVPIEDSKGKEEGDGEKVKQNPFKDNPFANLNMASRPRGSAFESGIKYQAPTAAEALAAAMPQLPDDPSTTAAPAEGEKKQGLISREIKNAKQGLGVFMKEAKEKRRSLLRSQKSPGDRGRDSTFVNQAVQYEARRRMKEEKAKERKTK